MVIIKKNIQQTIKTDHPVNDNVLYISGYASLFGGSPDGYGDVVQQGAFRNTLTKLNNVQYKLPMLWNHNVDNVIGVWDDLKEDSVGLWVKGRIFENTEQGAYISKCIQNTSVSGISIGFNILKASKNKDYRLIEAINLLEISIVTIPAKEDARIQSILVS
jgi:uncharacterized protein